MFLRQFRAFDFEKNIVKHGLIFCEMAIKLALQGFRTNQSKKITFTENLVQNILAIY